MKKVESISSLRAYYENIINSKNIYINSILFTDLFFGTNNNLLISEIFYINYINLNNDFKILISNSPEDSFTFIYFKENNKLKNCVLVNLQSEGMRGIIIFKEEAMELVNNGLNILSSNNLFINNNFEIKQTTKESKNKIYTYPLFLFNNKNEYIEFQMKFKDSKTVFHTNFTLHPVK